MDFGTGLPQGPVCFATHVPVPVVVEELRTENSEVRTDRELRSQKSEVRLEVDF